MPRQYLEPLAVTACCLLLLAALGGSMDAVVETDPEDAFTFDNPLVESGSEATAELREDIQRGMEREEARQSPEETMDQAASQAADAGETLWDQIRALLALLVSFLVYAFIAVATALLAENRDRLRALLGRSSPGPNLVEQLGNGENAWTTQPTGVSNEVERLWFSMLVHFDLPADRSKTPRDYAAEATRLGGDTEAVDLLTTLFEQVRYGNRVPDDQSVALARKQLELIRNGNGRVRP